MIYSSKLDEAISCSQCGNVAKLFKKSFDYHKRISKVEFNYYRCNNCGYIFLYNIPENLGDYYPEEYYALPNNTQELERNAFFSQKWKIDTVLNFKSGGTLLEIGPAYGLFAFLAKRFGFDVTAIEMDRRCCEFLSETVGINVIENDDTAAALQDLPPFDVIVMWQVFEHLRDPWPLLKQLTEKLRPDGILVLDVPNPDAFQFKILGRRWVHLDPPRHVSLIPIELMIKRAAEQGLKTEFLTTCNFGANSYNGFGWAYSFKNVFGNNFIGDVAYFIGRVLSKVLIPFERTGRRGSTYTIVLRKGSRV